MLRLLDSLFGYFRGIEQDDLETLGTRGALRLRRAFNQGIGQFYLALLALLGTGICSDHWFVLDRYYQSRIERSLDDVLLVERPEGSRARYPALDAAVMTLGPDQSPDCVPAESADCRAMARAHEVFVALANHALRFEPPPSLRGEEGGGLGPTATPIRDDSDGSNGSPARAPAGTCKRRMGRLAVRGISQSAVNASCVVARRLRTSNRADIPPCAESKGSDGYGAARIGAATRHAGCELANSQRLSSLLVPEGLGRDAQEVRDGGGPPAIEYRDDVSRGIELSELLEPTLQDALPVLKTDDLAPDGDGAPIRSRFIQAFFISKESVLRIWSRDSLDPIANLPRHARWALAPYFSALQQPHAGRDFTLPLYVDHNLNGIVSTRCSAVREVSAHDDNLLDDTTAADENRRNLLGTFCTDFTVPEQSFLATLVSRPFFEAVYVMLPAHVVQLESDVVVRRLEPNGTPGAVVPVDRSGLPSGDFPQRVRRSIFARLERADAAARSQFFGELTHLGDVEGFFVPLSRHANGMLSAAAFRVTRPGRGWANVFGAFAAALGFLTTALAIAGLVLSRRIAAFNRRLDLLRNLQVGVISVNEQDEIELANDRAEEVLRAKLPKAETSGTKTSFANLIQPHVVMAIGSRPSARSEPYDHVGRHRREGRHSTYFARLRAHDPGHPSDGWIRVSASPLVADGRMRAGRAPRTFGVVDLVPEELGRELTRTPSERDRADHWRAP